MNTESQANAGVPWTTTEAALELLIAGFATVPGTNGLTDTQLRATSVPVTGPITSVTPSASVVSTSGSITSGARFADLLFSSDFEGTLLGVAILGSAISSYSFPPIGEHVYGTIAYTRSAGSITIFKGV